MSEENVENYRRVAAAWARGDLDAALAFADKDAEIISRVDVIEGSYRGHEGVRRWWQDLHDSFPDWDAEVGEVRALGDAELHDPPDASQAISASSRCERHRCGFFARAAPWSTTLIGCSAQ